MAEAASTRPALINGPDVFEYGTDASKVLFIRKTDSEPENTRNHRGILNYFDLLGGKPIKSPTEKMYIAAPLPLPGEG